MKCECEAYNGQHHPLLGNCDNTSMLEWAWNDSNLCHECAFYKEERNPEEFWGMKTFSIESFCTAETAEDCPWLIAVLYPMTDKMGG